MSLRENSCFSLCPFLNKDLRLPRQQRLRQAPNATGAASEGHKLQKRFSFLPYFFSPPLFQLYFCHAPLLNNRIFIEKFPPGAIRVLLPDPLLPYNHYLAVPRIHISI